MSTTYSSPSALSMRYVGRLRMGSARIAFGALIAFLVVVFACPGTVFPVLAPYVPAKGVAGLALVALVVSWLLYDRKLVSGGAIGAGLVVVALLALASPLWSTWPKESF